MTTEFIFLVVLPVVLICLDYANGMALFRQLRTEFPALWRDLDEPALDAANYASSRLKLTRFIWTGRFLHANSASFTLHCVVAIGIQIALLACLAFGIFRAAT